MATTQTAETRKDAARALGAMSSAVHPKKTGLGGKIAIAGTVLRLVRRYPTAALVVGGVALAVYLGRRRAYDAAARYY
jgi:hypothetical protein